MEDKPHEAHPLGHRFVNTEQAATLTGLSRRTLEAYRVQGRGPRYYKHGAGGNAGLVLYDPLDIQAWLDSRRRRSTSDPGQTEATHS